MFQYEFIEETPSRQLALLQQLKGRTIRKLTRCCWDSFEDFDPDHLYHIEKENYFRFSAGSVVVELDNGVEVSFSPIEEMASIVVWLQKDAEGPVEDYFRDDEDVVFVENKEHSFTTERERNLSGKKIVSVAILKRKPQSVLYEDLPNEAGVELKLENGERLVFAHNLINAPDSFALAYREEIPKKTASDLTRQKVF